MPSSTQALPDTVRPLTPREELIRTFIVMNSQPAPKDETPQRRLCRMFATRHPQAAKRPAPKVRVNRHEHRAVAPRVVPCQARNREAAPKPSAKRAASRQPDGGEPPDGEPDGPAPARRLFHTSGDLLILTPADRAGVVA